MTFVIFLLLFLVPSLAEAANRYVDASLSATCVGSTYSIASRNCTGTDGTGYKTLREGLRAMVASDQVFIRAGSYNATTGTGTYGNTALDTWGCTPSCPTSWETATRVSNYPGETAIITGAFNLDSAITGGPIEYLIIQGDVRANLIVQGGSGGWRFHGGLTHVRLQTTTVQNSTENGISGGGNCSTTFATDIQIIDNLIQSNGDATSGSGPINEHGIYPGCSRSWLVERNTIRNNHAWQVHFYASGVNNHLNATIRYNLVEGHKSGSTSGSGILISQGSGHRIHNNVVVSPGSGGAALQNCIDLYGTQTGTKVYNNTCYGMPIGVFLSNSGVTNVIVKNNIFDNVTTPLSNTGGTIASWTHNLCPAATPDCGVSGSTNTVETADPGFVSAGTNFALASGSAAINAGTATIASGDTINYNGSAPDIGAFETFGYSSATVNENSLDVTLQMSVAAFVPVLPASGQTGWTVEVGGVARNTVSAAKLTGTDSKVRIVFDGAVCAGGETWTVTYSGSGNVTDSALIGSLAGTANQPLSAFTDQAVTNSCGSAPPAEPGTPRVHYKLDDNTGTNAADEETVEGGNEPGTLTGSTPTWVTGKHSFGVQTTDLVDNYIAVPYGSGVNPSTQSLTVCVGVLPNAGTESLARSYFGAQFNASQRLFMSYYLGTWTFAIQANNIAQNNDFPVSAGWSRICLVMDSGTDTATLWVNGVKGTSAQSVQAYTSFTFASNFRIGKPQDMNASVAPGATFDEFKIWTSALSDEDLADDYAAWEPQSPSPTGTYEQKTHQWQLLRKKADNSAESYGAAGATVTVVVGGAVALVTQIDCTVADCDPLQLRLFSTNDGGTTWLAVPDVFGSHNVAFYGTPDADVVAGTVTCCLTGALTTNNGSTQTTSSAVPNIDLAQNASFVRRSILKFDTDASGTICFKEYNQDGNALDTYTPSAGACVTIGPNTAGVGF
jgi:hypothetical protein